jgi:uncharacterized damage-inducible protein DinB
MSLKTSIRNSVDYNIWVTEQLVNWLSNYPEELLQKECSSSFSSIAKTLKHISDTQLYWSSMIRETPIPGFDYMATDVAKVLATYVKENNEAMSERRLIESEWFSSNFPKYEYLQHLIIHTTYHRGQIVTIGHNIGVLKAPMMDYNFWNVMNQQNK